MESLKKSKGKQKIEIKRIEKEVDRIVTFSKRKSGIYKKASEITTLCDAQFCFLAFSEAGKPYSYGYPSIDSVISRFFNENQQVNNQYQTLLQTQQKKRENEEAKRYNNLVNFFEAEKLQNKILLETKKASEATKGWWELNINELGKDELEKFNASLKKFQDSLLKIIDQNLKA